MNFKSSILSPLNYQGYWVGTLSFSRIRLDPSTERLEILTSSFFVGYLQLNFPSWWILGFLSAAPMFLNVKKMEAQVHLTLTKMSDLGFLISLDFDM